MASPWEQAKAKQEISAPKQSKYHGYQGQSGGTSSIPSSGKKDSFRELQRQKFFGDRRDIPADRIDRRTRQEGALNQFKQNLINQGRVMRDSRGNVVLNANTGQPIYLSETPGGRTVSSYAQSLANRFGPTPKEIAGDIGSAVSSMAKGYGIPFVSTATKIGNAVSDAWNKVRGFFSPSQTPQGIETQFPQPTSDMKDSFSSMGIDTGIASTDPNNMLVQIAKDKQYENIPFQDLLANASVQAGDRPVLPPNVVPKTIVAEPTPKEMNLYKTPVLPPEVTDPRVYEGQRLYAENIIPTSVMDLYNVARNPQVNTPYGNLRLDNVLSGNPQLGFETDFFGGKIGLSANPLQDQYGANYTLTFNKGGSVNKYSGLGYMLK